ncbi:hypothetical protein GCM10009722_01810 [Williamsia deligens]
MNTLFLVSAAVAAVGGVCALLLVRTRDFVAAHAPETPVRATEPVETA